MSVQQRLGKARVCLAALKRLILLRHWLAGLSH